MYHSETQNTVLTKVTLLKQNVKSMLVSSFCIHFPIVMLVNPLLKSQRSATDAFRLRAAPGLY